MIRCNRGLKGLQQSYLPGIGGYNRRVQAYSAILTGKLGTFNLTSVSGYNINAYADSLRLYIGLRGSPPRSFSRASRGQ